MKLFKFQLFSDIHLEYYKSFPIIPKIEKYLILAGDIGKIDTNNYKSFFDYSLIIVLLIGKKYFIF
jgi:hypothetical protein